MLTDQQLAYLRRETDRIHQQGDFTPELERRRKLSSEFRTFIERTGVLEGGTLSRDDLSELVRIVSQIQRYNPAMLPQLMGSYEYHTHFKGFSGSREEFDAEMRQKRPNWTGGEPGVDLEDFSRSLRELLTSEGDRQVDGFVSFFQQPAIQKAFATTVLMLMHPERNPRVNRPIMMYLRNPGPLQISSARRKQQRDALRARLGARYPQAAVLTYSWLGILTEIRRQLGCSDFLELDVILSKLSAHTETQPEAVETTATATVDVDALLDQIEPDQLAERQAAEEQARQLITDKLGRMSAQDIRQLLKHLSRDRSRGNTTSNRFAPAFVGNLANRLADAADITNRWIERLWTADHSDIAKVLDEFWESKELHGAGRSFPSAILYLRDSSKYQVLTGGLYRGYAKVDPTPVPNPRRNGDRYLDYCEALNRLRQAYGFVPQATDMLLFLAQKADVVVEPVSPEPPPSGEYTRERALYDTLLREDELTELEQLLADKAQLILYGPPGTGKTWIAERLARYLAGPNGSVRKVQFHPSYGYEDFVEGIRPVVNEGAGTLQYRVEPGIFRQVCEHASQNADATHVLLIDEINRGNLPRIFGELLYALERRDEALDLPVSREPLQVPKNLVVIGTMNSADHSIALVDVALRRRFHFYRLDPDADRLSQWLARHRPEMRWVGQLLELLNGKLHEAGIEPDMFIGQSHFMHDQLDEGRLALVWQRSIVPTLEEYFYGRRDLLDSFDLETLSEEAQGASPSPDAVETEDEDDDLEEAAQ